MVELIRVWFCQHIKHLHATGALTCCLLPGTNNFTAQAALMLSDMDTGEVPQIKVRHLMIEEEA